MHDRFSLAVGVLITEPGFLCGDLSELEKGIQHAERKRIYETLHPETRHITEKGGPGRGNKTTDNLSVVLPSYSADASAATGVSERAVRRNTRFGEVLKPYRAELTGTVIEDNQRELLRH